MNALISFNLSVYPNTLKLIITDLSTNPWGMPPVTGAYLTPTLRVQLSTVQPIPYPPGGSHIECLWFGDKGVKWDSVKLIDL